MSEEPVSKEELRDDTDRRIRELASRLDVVGAFDPFGALDQATMYVPPGPVAQAFLNSTALTAVLMGPLGGGKTTTCAFKRLMCAARAPIAWDPDYPRSFERGKPTRLCRGIVLRDTFRSAEKTVLESWKQWFPKNYPGSSTQGGNDRPYEHILRFMGGDGVRVQAVTEFAGLGENSIETMMKGREYSFAWLNELDTHAKGALDDVEQRLGRFPMPDLLLDPDELAFLAKRLGHRVASGERMKTAIGDMNAPTVDNWTFEALVTNRAPGRDFFSQPSALAADAENLFNLPGGARYYTDMVEKQPEHFVNRLIHNKFGYSRAGKPVHPSFDYTRHVAQSEIAFRPQLDLHIGLDISTGGLSPAAVLGQAATRISLLDELFVDQGCGPARFGEGLKMLLQERYPNVERRHVKLWPDPAAIGGADREQGELDAIETISAILGLPWLLPFDGSNELSMRLGAVDTELRGYHEAQTSLLISPRCPLYIAGIGGRYRFRKRPAAASNEFEDLPEKSHPWSDIQDAGQYLIGGIRGRAALRRAKTDEDNAPTGWRSQAAGGTVRRRSFDVHRVGR